MAAREDASDAQDGGGRGRVRLALRQRRVGAGFASRYLLSGLLKCAECEASFALSNGTRYQCSSHHDGGDAACDVGLSLIRTVAEKHILDFVETDLLHLPTLEKIEAAYRSSRPATVDYRPRIAELERQVQQFVKVIGAGEYSPAVSAALKASEAELEQLKAMGAPHARSARKASMEPLARRVARMRERLAKGGDVARAALREVFPDPIWLQVAPSGKHFYAIFEDGIRAALGFDDTAKLTDFPVEEADGGLRKVANNGSGGTHRLIPTPRRLSLAA